MVFRRFETPVSCLSCRLFKRTIGLQLRAVGLEYALDSKDNAIHMLDRETAAVYVHQLLHEADQYYVNWSIDVVEIMTLLREKVKLDFENSNECLREAFETDDYYIADSVKLHANFDWDADASGAKRAL